MGGLALGAALAGRWAVDADAEAGAADLRGTRTGRCGAGDRAAVRTARAVAGLRIGVPEWIRRRVPSGSCASASSLSAAAASGDGARCHVSAGRAMVRAGEPRSSRRAGQLYAANTIGAAVGALLSGFVLVPADRCLRYAPRRCRRQPGRDGGPGAGPRDARDRRCRARNRSVRRSQARATANGARKSKAVTGACPCCATRHGCCAARSGGGAARDHRRRDIHRRSGMDACVRAARRTVHLCVCGDGGRVHRRAGARRHARNGDRRHGPTPRVAIGLLLGGATIGSAWASTAAGTSLPHRVVADFASSPDISIVSHAITLSLTCCRWPSPSVRRFRSALQLAGGADAPPRTIGSVYAINTMAAVAGSLLTGFFLIPVLGLERTLTVVSATARRRGSARGVVRRQQRTARAGGARACRGWAAAHR